jgi:hypothetical protein
MCCDRPARRRSVCDRLLHHVPYGLPRRATPSSIPLRQPGKGTRLGQKIAFQVDASRVARLPLTLDYFPEMSGSNIPVRGRDAELVTKVEERLRELVAAGFQITRVDAIARHLK